MTIAATRTADAVRSDYLELLKRSLLGELEAPSRDLEPIGASSNPLLRVVQRRLDDRGLVLAAPAVEDAAERREGRIWPRRAMTMVGRRRLDNLQHCIEDVLAQGVPGDVIETGAWRGGASIFMRAVLNAHGATDRSVWVADSFAGLPAPDARYPADSASTFHLQAPLAISLEEVRANFERYGLLDDGVRFLEGWFRDTLPSTHDRTWAVIRLDGDMYESTIDALGNLYENLSPGGWAIIDDYKIDSCHEAVTDFRAEHGIDEPLQEIDWTGVCWQRRR